MKVKFLRGLAAVSTGATAITAICASPAVALVPASYIWIPGIVALASLAIKDGALAVGDRLDDGQANGSFKG